MFGIYTQFGHYSNYSYNKNCTIPYFIKLIRTVPISPLVVLPLYWLPCKFWRNSIFIRIQQGDITLKINTEFNFNILIKIFFIVWCSKISKMLKFDFISKFQIALTMFSKSLTGYRLPMRYIPI